MHRRCNTARKVQDLLEVMIGEQGKELMGADAWNAMSAKRTCPAAHPPTRTTRTLPRPPGGAPLTALAFGPAVVTAPYCRDHLHPPALHPLPHCILCSHGVNP